MCIEFYINCFNVPIDLTFEVLKYLNPNDLFGVCLLVSSRWYCTIAASNVWDLYESRHGILSRITYNPQLLLCDRRSKGRIYVGKYYKCGNENREDIVIRVIDLALINAGYDDGVPASILRECSYIQKLDHPSILKCYGAQIIDKNLYIISEYIKYNLLNYLYIIRYHLLDYIHNEPLIKSLSTPPEVQSLSSQFPITVEASPLEVTSTTSPSTIPLAESSFNYLSLKSNPTPGDRGEGSDGSSIMGMMEDGSKDVLNVTSSGIPAADLREAEGEVNRRADGRTSSDIPSCRRTSLKSLILEIFRDLILSLHFLHSRDIIHRNLKPENIFVICDGGLEYKGLKIGDLYSSRFMCNSNKEYTPEWPKERNRSYREDRRMYYKAPEIILRYKFYDKAIDIWAAGIIFYEMCCNKTIFNADSEINLLWNIFATFGFPNQKIIQSLPKELQHNWNLLINPWKPIKRKHIIKW